MDLGAINYKGILRPGVECSPKGGGFKCIPGQVRRLVAANEAMALGYGGVSMVSRASGLSIPTIRTGLEELARPDAVVQDRVRRPGGGRKVSRKCYYRSAPYQ